MKSFLAVAMMAGLTFGAFANASVLILDTKSGTTTCVEVHRTETGWKLDKVALDRCDGRSSQLLFSKALETPGDDVEFIPILGRGGPQ